MFCSSSCAVGDDAMSARLASAGERGLPFSIRHQIVTLLLTLFRLQVNWASFGLSLSLVLKCKAFDDIAQCVD